MPKQPKKPAPRPVGRPKMEHGQAKGKIVALRFSSHDHAKLTATAAAKGHSVSKFIREAIDAAI